MERLNVPEKYSESFFVLEVSALEGVNLAKASRFSLWVNEAYFKTSIACHLYDMWVLKMIDLDLWLVKTQEAMNLFAKREARELLR